MHCFCLLGVSSFVFVIQVRDMIKRCLYGSGLTGERFHVDETSYMGYFDLMGLIRNRFGIMFCENCYVL